jgi:hypothetical protein
MWREVLIAKHKNLAIGQHLSEFPLRLWAWLSQIDPGNLGAERGHDWTRIDMRESLGRDCFQRLKGFKSVMGSLAWHRGLAPYRECVGLCHSWTPLLQARQRHRAVGTQATSRREKVQAMVRLLPASSVENVHKRQRVRHGPQSAIPRHHLPPLPNHLNPATSA